MMQVVNVDEDEGIVPNMNLLPEDSTNQLCENIYSFNIYKYKL